MLLKLTTNILLCVLLVIIPTAATTNHLDDPPKLVYLPLVGRSFYTGDPPLLISALYYDTYLTGEPDEAFQVYNPLASAVSLVGWKVTAGARTVTFPAEMTLNANVKLWCAYKAIDFRQTFGAPAGCEYGGDTDPAVPDLTGAALTLTNTGGRVALSSPNGSYADVLAYEAGDASAPGWQGPAVYPYKPSTTFGEAGQILYRKLDQLTGLPVPDTDTRADWAQDPNDLINGRKAQYPGWQLDRFFMPAAVTQNATLSAFVAPDNAFKSLRTLLEGAQHSIRFEGYTLDNARLGEIIAAQARAGVDVEIILEGSPPGGVTDQQLWVVQQIAQAGGRIYYFRSAAAAGIHKRYTYQHAKFCVLDGSTALIGSENLNPEAFPDDPKADGTWGRRGIYLVTNAPSVVAELTAVMDADIAPGVYRDVWAWDPADPTLGAPPTGFVPSYDSGGNLYPVQKPTPLVAQGSFIFQLIHSPEQTLRDQDSLLGLINRAGAGDTILVEQLYENTYWGAESSNVTADPNPRLLAYIAAARRGAKVRVLLDAFFDNQDLTSPRSNLRTVEYLTAVARAERLDLQARRGNPTGLGIHNKMVLAQISGKGWSIVGSLNGGEVSAKLNREMALLVGSDEVYNYLADVFRYDWDATP
jgi:cardiolipin synthase A/B